MSSVGPTITAIRARAVVVPLQRPMRTAVGLIPSSPLVLIDVDTSEEVRGSAYIFTYTEAALKPTLTLAENIGAEMIGKSGAPLERLRGSDARFRLLGTEGLVGMVIAGFDMALWDALGRAAGRSVAELLGADAKPVRAYDSFGIIDPRAEEAEIRRSLDRGFQGIKLKIGGGELAADLEAVRALRAIVGPEIRLMVDYNQSLDPVEACSRLARLRDFDLHWVEEPVRADDLAGHARVRAEAGVKVQTGENWWFPADCARAIAAGASDFAMLDVMKIGGISGWIRAAALAEAASLPVSSHAFIEASAHALAATPSAHWLEYLDKAGPILKEPLQVVAGTITPTGPGLGMAWDEKAVARYAA